MRVTVVEYLGSNGSRPPLHQVELPEELAKRFHPLEKRSVAIGIHGVSGDRRVSFVDFMTDTPLIGRSWEEGFTLTEAVHDLIAKTEPHAVLSAKSAADQMRRHHGGDVEVDPQEIRNASELGIPEHPAGDPGFGPNEEGV